MAIHRWSGWPGAFCLKCGAEDPYEYALAMNYYDPLTDSWDTEEHMVACFQALNCPVEDKNEIT